MPKRYNNSVVLCFGDTHAPYHHKNTLDFLNKLKKEYNPDRVFHLGDHGDIYSVSDYPKDLEHPDTFTSEIKGLRKFTQDLGKIFSELTILESNHDQRVYKRSRVSGIPREFLVKYLDVISAPSGWRLVPNARFRVESTKDSFFLSHTINSGSLAAAKQLNISTVIGHSHTKFGAQSFHNGSKLIWGVDAGCLISDRGSPFSYNSKQIGRPIRGCAVIIDGIPQLIPFDI